MTGVNWTEQQLLYSGGQLVVDRGTADVLERDGEDMFVHDRVSDSYFLLTMDEGKGLRWLADHENCNYSILCVCTPHLFEFIRQRYPHDQEMICFQLAYLHPQPPEVQGSLEVREARQSDLAFIADNYHLYDEKQLRQAVNAGRILMGEKDGELIGFIGTHPEGSMGLLVILPQYRRKGYGEQLERLQIGKLMQQGIIPTCQVSVDNEASLRLQERIGLRRSQLLQYWIF